MKIKSPCIITSRLLPGVKIADTTISIDLHDYSAEGRMIYQFYIDTPDYSYESTDLQSGVGSGSLQDGLESLLTFLLAFAEARNYGPNADSWDLFPDKLAEFAVQNSDEIGMLALELEETPNLIEEQTNES